jgi:hypothetical protein
MKRLTPTLLSAAFGLAVLGSTTALAQPYQPVHPPGQVPGYNHPPGPPGGYNHPPGPPGGYDHPPGPPPEAFNHPPGPPPQAHWQGDGRRWHPGDHYDGQRYAVQNWGYYHLRQPPAGYEWVQDGSQFVLIAVASGIIADIILNSQQ